MSSEFDVHKTIVKHLRFRGTQFMVPIHINNTPRGERHGARLKKIGLVAGVPDMVYAFQGRTLWHEIKTETGRLSQDQKDFHLRLAHAGHEVIVTYGLDDALRQLIEKGVITGGQ